MKTAVTIIFLLLSSFLLYSQQFNVERPVITDFSQRWGDDFLLLNNEPIGGFYGIQRSDGKIFVAVNDTTATANLGLIILTSSNKGHNWELYNSGVPIREQLTNIKMIRSGLDSIYCFFQAGTNVYCWNIERSFINSIHHGNYRSYDVVASSTGNLYAFMDSLPNSSIVRYSSIDGGSNWVTRSTVTSAGALPRTEMSHTGDTLILNYYGPVLTDTATSAIRAARYRESGVGVLTSINFMDVAPAGPLKNEFKTARGCGEVFFVYTSGPVGTVDLFFRKSLDNGTNYHPETPVSNFLSVDEFWLDIKPAGSGGFDIVYFAEGLVEDNIVHTYNQYGDLNQPITFNIINQYPPVLSAAGYSPKLVELYYSSNDLGIVYVANVNGSKKVMWDYRTNVVPVELISFNADYLNGSVVLNWITASELNNYGFEIEREDNNNWIKAGFIPGSGTTTNKMYYTYTDKVGAGKYQYRLKQIDNDGSFNYSAIVTVEAGIPDNFALFQNYPNPFNPSTAIKFNLPVNEVVTIKVTDMLGNQVSILLNEERSAGTHEISFNAAGLSSGIYFVIMNAGSYSETIKMMLLK
jgi:hypothetical protein